MSRAPLQEWQPHLDSRSLEMRARATDDATQGLAAYPNQPYSVQEPPPYLLPDSQGYDPTFATTHPKSVAQGKTWDSTAEHRYSLSFGSAGPMFQYGVQRSALSRTVEHPGVSSPYFETSSQGRGSIGSGGRSNDMDSQ